jgi:hypothetical protein
MLAAFRARGLLTAATSVAEAARPWVRLTTTAAKGAQQPANTPHSDDLGRQKRCVARSVPTWANVTRSKLQAGGAHRSVAHARRVCRREACRVQAAISASWICMICLPLLHCAHLGAFGRSEKGRLPPPPGTQCPAIVNAFSLAPAPPPPRTSIVSDTINTAIHVTHRSFSARSTTNNSPSPGAPARGPARGLPVAVSAADKNHGTAQDRRDSGAAWRRVAAGASTRVRAPAGNAGAARAPQPAAVWVHAERAAV